ncbi:MAG TPA: Mur ligase family protein, partial [Gemmatimonadales bacterium]
VHLDDAARERAIGAWRTEVRRLLEAVGWGGETIASRTFAGGASLAFTAPPDALYAATDLNEAAWERAAKPPGLPAKVLVERLRAAIVAERNPALLALREAARDRGVTFLSGEERVSVGSGTGVTAWPEAALPAPDDVDWSRVHDVPIALITGSNGKTTVVRLLAAILTEAGLAAGATTTDGVTVGGTIVEAGDYSGPSGARLLLRRADVEAAVLETARGGLLRRGLPVERARVAVVTNVADDHLGEYGVQDLDTLADVKMLVARAVDAAGAVVLNADDARLRERAGAADVPVVWFHAGRRDGETERRREGGRTGGRAAVCEEGQLVLVEGGARTGVVPVDEVPIAAGGAARHNVANALAAVAAASVLGVPVETIARALRRFGRNGKDNAGRANFMDRGGVRVLVDYAHNPHGMAALAEMARGIPARRRLIMIGQAGDRSDEAIRELARAALALEPDRILLKDMDRYLRGRAPGEVPSLMADELARRGVPADAVSRPGSELDAVREALAWARPEDLLVLTVHQDRDEVLELLGGGKTEG